MPVAQASGLPAYAELHCLSNFSFLRGASHPEELVERAQALGYQALALTDECSVAGVVRAYIACRDTTLQLIIGTELCLADGLRLVLLATDRTGYGQMCERITRARRRCVKGRYELHRSDLESGMEGCLALLLSTRLDTSDPSHVMSAEPSDQRPAGPSRGKSASPVRTHQVPGLASDLALSQAQWLAQTFAGRAWIAVELHGGQTDRAELRRLRQLAQAVGLPLMAAGDVHMHVRSRRRVQDTLSAVRLGLPLARCGRQLFPNAERHLRSRVRLAQIYPDELLEQTITITRRCQFSLDELRYEYPDEIVEPGHTADSYLRLLTEQGLLWRYGPGGANATVRAQIEHELALIIRLRYEPYFLTVYDIVRFARSQGILCQGRGSAANSAVCYALGITEVNPATSSLLFERFISEERNEPPDIDVDFEHERREEVIQYIYGKYGRERAAIAAAVSTYRPRSAVRDIGKALGLDPLQLDQLARSHVWWDGQAVQAEGLAAQGFDPQSRVIRQLAILVNTITRFPRHLSQHSGGFVISRGPLSHLVPVENAAMPGRSVIQWDKDDLDALGLLKIDILALGMLSAVRKTVDLLNGYYPGAGRAGYALPAWWSALAGRAFTVADIPQDDPAVYAMISRADTVGVFQIESRAQMSMLPRLQPREFYDLVIEVAIVRPGPIQGGMVHPSLRRRQGKESVTYPNPEVEQVLKRTLGVAIFQEQVMRLAVVAAGFSPGEADQLRRAMAAWRRKGGIEPFEQRLLEGMARRGYPAEFAQQVYAQIRGFGEYGFPESHSISFALIAYQSAWLKCHEPAAFLAALLNSQPMGFYAPAQLVQDARRHGVDVRAVDVAASGWDATLEYTSQTPQPAVRLGLSLVKGFPAAAAARLEQARAQRPFASVDDLAERAALDSAELKCLAAAAALDSLSEHRRAAYWQVAGIETRPPLLREAPIEETVPRLSPPGEGENLVADYASTGLTLGRHPLALLRARLTGLRIVTAADLRQMPQGRLARASGLVIGRQRPETAAGVVFVTLEDETGQINVVVWRALAERQRREVLGSQLMTVYGQVEREGEVVHLVAQRVVDHSVWLGRLSARSRDFH